MTRPSREDLAVVLPAALLALVACTQIALTFLTPLSPWKGGGFGMFASLDSLQFREVRVYVEGPDRSEELALPDSLLLPANRVAVLPTARAMDRLASHVFAREARRGTPADRVRVEIWKTTFSSTLESTSLKIAARTVQDARLARSAR